MGEPVVDGTPVEAVTAARVEASREVRVPTGGLAVLVVGVARSTIAVALGVPVATVFPVGVGLFLLAPVALALWLRSLAATLAVETAWATHRERLDDRLVERLSR